MPLQKRINRIRTKKPIECVYNSVSLEPEELQRKLDCAFDLLFEQVIQDGKLEGESLVDKEIIKVNTK